MKDFEDLSIFTKAAIIGESTGKKDNSKHYDYVKGFDSKILNELKLNCRILHSTEVYGGTIYKLAMKSSLFKNIAENSKYKPLKVILKTNKSAEDTDFSRVLRCTKENNNQYWLHSVYADNDYGDYVDKSGDTNYTYSNSLNIGTRPVLPFKLISKFCSNLSEQNGILKFEFGDYPQDIVDLEESKILEKLYSNNELEKTGRKFSINNEKKDDLNTSHSIFTIEELDEYYFNNKKYVRVIPKIDNILKNGQIIQKDKPVWIEVKPIKWIVDKDEDIAISEKILFSGISYLSINSFLDYCFIDEMLADNFFKMERIDQNFLEQYILYKSQKNKFR